MRCVALAVIGAFPFVAACQATTSEERAELAAWNGCIETAIAQRQVAGGHFRIDGSQVFFEVTYECRSVFPDWDPGPNGKSKRGRKLIDSLYSRLANHRAHPELSTPLDSQK